MNEALQSDWTKPGFVEKHHVYERTVWHDTNFSRAKGIGYAQRDLELDTCDFTDGKDLIAARDSSKGVL